MNKTRSMCSAALDGRSLVAALGALVGALAFASPATSVGQEAASEDQRFLDGLLQRQMFRLAESFCRRKLESQGLEPLERGQMTLELIRTQGRRALNSRSPEREQVFRSAIDTAQQFERTDSLNPLIPLIRMQRALTALAQAEQARQEAEVGASPAAELAKARDALRSAAQALERLDKDLTLEIPQRRRNPPTKPGELSADELFSLQNNGRLQLARAYRNQALCYPAESDDRIAALTQALQQLVEPLRELPAADPLAWRVKMDRAACVRLLGNVPTAEQMLAELLAESAPLEIRRQALAERARLLLSTKRAAEAWRLIESARGAADLEYARLEVLSELLRAEQDKRAADLLRRDALAAVTAIEESYGAYWGRRASQLLVRSAAGPNMGSGSVEILRRTAETHFQKKQFDEAIEAYGKAAVQAQQLGDLKSAFDFLLKAALIRREQGDVEQYAASLQQASLKLRDYERAGDAHLAAIIATAQRKPPPLDAYEALLAEHLEVWPQRESAHQVRLWLARLHHARSQYDLAVAALRAVAADSKHFDEATRTSAAYYENWFGSAPKTAERDALVDRAAQQFENVVLEGGAFPEEWSDLDRFCALTAARLRLAYRDNDFAQAERLLAAALIGSRDADPKWSQSANATLVAAMAGQPQRRAAAAQLMQSIGGAAPIELLELLDNLTRIADTAAPNVKREIGLLQRNAVDLLQKNGSQLNKTQLLKLQRTRAEALAAIGEVAESLREYERLATANPRDARIQVGYAKALTADPQSLSRALSQWRVVARGSKPNSAQWLDAKYNVAVILKRTGKTKEAESRVRYLLETGNLSAEQKRRFAALLR